MNNKIGTYALSGDQGCDDRILSPRGPSDLGDPGGSWIPGDDCRYSFVIHPHFSVYSFTKCFSYKVVRS